ncbi:BQ2448_2828 [Microbotryum intermedium]|uniref:BQ2448_2828 protein n=1 Tax=Microbotryum intermedium TaxID=269621 RepID=A0A238FBM0_9BASI|nr:BQ2448_2828 [Microbotryum intermedium]
MSSSNRAPRWSTLLRDSLDRSMKGNKDSISFAFTTLDAVSGESSTRFVVHRGFVNERRSNEDSSWSKNPSEDAQGVKLVNDNLIVTTDVRAPKALALEANPTTSLAWWHLPTMTQFRIRSQAYPVKPPSRGNPTSAQILDRLSPVENFDWEAERIRIFHKMSPELRASFVRPVPGSRLVDKEEAKEWPKELPASEEEAEREKEKGQVKEGELSWRKLGGESEEKTDARVCEFVCTALEHFALIILEPFDVDVSSVVVPNSCDLGAQPNTRVHFSREKGQGWQGAEWKEEDVVP